MFRKSINLVLASLAVLAFGTAAGCSLAAERGTSVQSSRDDRARLAGTWRYESNDPGAHQRVLLVLRADGTYTKTLDAVVNGSKYGGKHDGTWTARGMEVRLSGDGNWPAYTHDLSTFQRD